MKLSVKTKLITGGVALILILGGAGVLVNRHYVQNRPEQEILQTSQGELGKAKSQMIGREVVKPIISDMPNRISDHSSKDIEKNSLMQAEETKPVDIGNDSKDQKRPNVINLTPEQQQNYSTLARLLPRCYELFKLLGEIDQIENPPIPENLSGDDYAIWYHQKQIEIDKKYPNRAELKKKLNAEKNTILAELMRDFPQAIYREELDNGRYRIVFDGKKIREICGGFLPTDKTRPF